MKRLLLALIGAVSLPNAALADTLVDNVIGITLDDKNAVVTFNGLVIDDNGKVKQLLQRRDRRPADVDYRVDGRGRHLIPGMIDAHAHVMQIGQAALSLDLSRAQSLAEAQAMIADYAAKNPGLPWITGRGWNQEQWGLGRFPTAAELDGVTGNRPVWLIRVDGHAGWANSAAMARAGITAATRDPDGGKVEKQAGRPSGIFIDNAMPLIESQLPPMRPVDRDRALAKAQQVLLAKGVTAVADMGTSLDDWQSFRRAGDVGQLRIRIISYADSVETMVTIGGPGPTPWLYEDRLRLNGVKLYLDGAMGSRGAALKAPYADDPANRGLALTGETQLLNRMSRAAMDDFQIAAHAIGDRANAVLLDSIEELSLTYKGDRRWRVEHAQLVDPADIPRFANHGVVASMQPVHQTSDRVMAEARLGPARLAGAYAWRSIAATGARLAFGSDAPVEVPDPFEGMAVAISRVDARGEPAGGWQPQERISREAALAGFTTGAAFAGFAEARFGRLAPGLRADFLIVDRDITLASPTELRATRVIESWVNGRLEYDSANHSESPADSSASAASGR